MADNRYAHNGTVHIDRHTKPMPSLYRDMCLNGWQFSHWDEEYNQAVYKLGDAELRHYEDNWLVEYPHYDRPVFYQGWSIEQVTEDVIKELSG